MSTLQTVVVDQETLEAMLLPEILPLCEGKPPGYLGVLLIDRLTRGKYIGQRRWRLEGKVDTTGMNRAEPPKPAGDWVNHAACKGQRMVYDTFGAHYTKITRADREMERKALATCETCPVLIQCRMWALQASEPAVDHVAGGLTPRQRAEWRRKRGRS